MRTITLKLVALAFPVVVSCNQTTEGTDTASATGHTESTSHESSGHGESAMADHANTQSSSEGTSAISSLITPYLQLKNALVKDDDKAAAAAGKELAQAIENFDKSALTPEQSKLYNDIESDAKEHAEHINANAGNIVHQREHFETLSEEMYELAKAVGTGQTLYYEFCPMYNNNIGGYWLSESKEIRNPYFGKEMLTCGSVKEEIK